MRHRIELTTPRVHSFTTAPSEALTSPKVLHAPQWRQKGSGVRRSRDLCYHYPTMLLMAPASRPHNDPFIIGECDEVKGVNHLGGPGKMAECAAS